MGRVLSWRRRVASREDVGAVRAAVLALGRAGGLETSVRSSLAVVVSEALRGVLGAGGGEAELEVDDGDLRITVHGPAEALRAVAEANRELIPDLELEGAVLRLGGQLPARDPDRLEAVVEALAEAPPELTEPLTHFDREVRDLLTRLAARDEALERLDAELEETNRGVVALYAELDQRDQRKNEFLATLAHELRNPLGVVGTAIHTVRDRNGLEGAAARPLEVAERQLFHLARLVDDLLDVSRIDQGKINLRMERLDLGRVVEEAVSSATALYDKKGHDLRLDLADAPLWVDGDPVRLEQVVDNLLTNAAKYTPEGGHVRVATHRDGDGAVLVVEDDGVGIAADMLGRIFQLFAQADKSLDRSSGGLGLGLALVERLVVLHGGTVTAESEGEGEGSRFTVTLPLAAIQGDEDVVDEDGEEMADDPQRPVSVLLVEDNDDAREMLALLLEGRGFVVDTASDGVQGVDKVKTAGPYDAAVVDIGLPGLDGYEVARQVRATPPGAALLLIALSGYGRSEDREQSAEAGFDHHLVKPVEPDELCKLLATAAGRADRPATP